MTEQRKLRYFFPPQPLGAGACSVLVPTAPFWVPVQLPGAGASLLGDLVS